MVDLPYAAMFNLSETPICLHTRIGYGLSPCYEEHAEP